MLFLPLLCTIICMRLRIRVSLPENSCRGFTTLAQTGLAGLRLIKGRPSGLSAVGLGGDRNVYPGSGPRKTHIFSMCACHPCAGAMLRFSVSFQCSRIIPEGNPVLGRKTHILCWEGGGFGGFVHFSQTRGW